jgi:hypothetical protein
LVGCNIPEQAAPSCHAGDFAFIAPEALFVATVTESKMMQLSKVPTIFFPGAFYFFLESAFKFGKESGS